MGKKVDKGVSGRLGVAVVVVGGQHRNFSQYSEVFKDEKWDEEEGQSQIFW